MTLRRNANLPNLLTLLRIGLTPVFLYMMFVDAWYGKGGAFLVFALASLTDFYDGRLARAGNQVTRFGRFLDPLADKILVTAGLIGLVFEHIVSMWLVVPIVLRDVIITGLRTYGWLHGRQMLTSRFARWKTAAQLVTVVLLLFLLAVRESMHHLRPDADVFLASAHVYVLAHIMVAAVLVLTVISGLQYLVKPAFFKDDA